MAPEPGAPRRDEDISDEASARICRHMNADHAVTVHAMALQSLPWKERDIHIDNAKLKSVTMSGYTLSFVLCDKKKDMCDMRLPAVPFSPPLTCSSQVKKRLIEIHQSVLSPRIYWLVTDPTALLILVVCSGLGFATYAIGESDLASHIKNMPELNSNIESIFGSAATFAKCVKWSWYFAFVVHWMEAIYGAYECKTTLKLRKNVTILWFFLIWCVGWPITARLKKFADMQKATNTERKKD